MCCCVLSQVARRVILKSMSRQYLLSNGQLNILQMSHFSIGRMQKRTTSAETLTTTTLIQIDIMSTRRHRPFRLMFGKRIELSNRPAMKPNMLAKLSIIGRKPITTSTSRQPRSLNRTKHGFSQISLFCFVLKIISDRFQKMLRSYRLTKRETSQQINRQ